MSVVVQEITLREYDALGGIHSRGSLSSFSGLTTEKAWFRYREVLGIVLLDNVDKDWSWVVMARHGDRNDNYRAIDLATSVATFEAARDQLKAAMIRAGAAFARFRDIITPDPDPFKP